MVVPYAPGGPTDTITRLLAQKMTEHVGQAVLRREYRWRRRQHRHGPRGKDGARRLHAADDQSELRGQSDALRQSPLRIRKGLRPGLARRSHHLGDHRPPVGAGAHASRSWSRSSGTIPANTATRRRGPGRRGISSAKRSAFRSASTLCMSRSTARAWRSVRTSRVIPRSASRRHRRPRNRCSRASCAASRSPARRARKPCRTCRPPPRPASKGAQRRAHAGRRNNLTTRRGHASLCPPSLRELITPAAPAPAPSSRSGRRARARARGRARAAAPRRRAPG